MLVPSIANTLLGPTTFIFVLVENKLHVLIPSFLWIPLNLLWIATSFFCLPLGLGALILSWMRPGLHPSRCKVALIVVAGYATSLLGASFLTSALSLNLRNH
jgi:hypothetical protein